MPSQTSPIYPPLSTRDIIYERPLLTHDIIYERPLHNLPATVVLFSVFFENSAKLKYDAELMMMLVDLKVESRFAIPGGRTQCGYGASLFGEDSATRVTAHCSAPRVTAL